VLTADVVAALEAEGLKYRLHPESGQCCVADSDLGRARMLLAAKGVAAATRGAGADGSQRSSGREPVRAGRAFPPRPEGELARSIGSLMPAGARASVVARSSSFVVNTGDKSSASVVLQLSPGSSSRTSRSRPSSIWCPAAWPGSTQRVALTDQAGNFLSARVDLSEGFDPLAQDGQSGKISAELRQNAQELLTAAVGAVTTA
jgi:flagellar M-ring protein FliF